MSSGYLVATFDLLNVRDLDLIEQAASRCDHLVVGVLSDEFVEQRLGRRPVVPADERVRLVGNVRGVDHALVHDDWPADLEVTFALRDEAFLIDGRPLVILESHRESRSTILQQALMPARMQAVA